MGDWCCLPYKGTNFSANHNALIQNFWWVFDVVYPTKVRIFQQITTLASTGLSGAEMSFTLQRYEFFSKSQRLALYIFQCVRCCLPYKGTNFSANHNHRGKRHCSGNRCCLPYKGTNFSANHNYSSIGKPLVRDVVYPTKVRIFQQITTPGGNGITILQMLFTLQRYEFFSKSQHNFLISVMFYRCCLPYKGTNFSANHNFFYFHFIWFLDVVYPTKVRIFQQITTSFCCKRIEYAMLFTLQRYEFFSKSQLKIRFRFSKKRCCLPYKGTNFSANHNVMCMSCMSLEMLFTLQRYEFFSKSQRDVYVVGLFRRCCLPYKGTNFSANHNNGFREEMKTFDVVYPTKVRIFQQITTHRTIYWCSEKMLFTLQRYEFFSKSQPHDKGQGEKVWCCLPYKGTNFSANHNC